MVLQSKSKLSICFFVRPSRLPSARHLKHQRWSVCLLRSSQVSWGQDWLRSVQQRRQQKAQVWINFSFISLSWKLLFDLLADGPWCHGGQTVTWCVHTTKSRNSHSLEKTGREGEECVQHSFSNHWFTDADWSVTSSVTSCYSTVDLNVSEEHFQFISCVSDLCFLCLVWQLTAEDETFLSENATASLSQFEKVTGNMGKKKILISHKMYN